ncbi:unnamed protein product [Dicrocoelium dendriticum]|nr:unnamed protein product [Dicrocoelium dendriticum]
MSASSRLCGVPAPYAPAPPCPPPTPFILTFLKFHTPRTVPPCPLHSPPPPASPPPSLSTPRRIPPAPFLAPPVYYPATALRPPNRARAPRHPADTGDHNSPNYPTGTRAHLPHHPPASNHDVPPSPGERVANTPHGGADPVGFEPQRCATNPLLPCPYSRAVQRAGPPTHRPIHRTPSPPHTRFMPRRPTARGSCLWSPALVSTRFATLDVSRTPLITITVPPPWQEGATLPVPIHSDIPTPICPPPKDINLVLSHADPPTHACPPHVADLPPPAIPVIQGSGARSSLRRI